MHRKMSFFIIIFVGFCLFSFKGAYSYEPFDQYQENKDPFIDMIAMPDAFESVELYNAMMNCYYFSQIGDYELAREYWNSYQQLRQAHQKS